jgi:replicative DNA helicase
VAVTDDLGTARPPRQPDFDRQPPQDLQAEQSVLGGMLLSKDAIADVVEVLRAGDFYRPAHQLVYETILDLYGRGEPADPVTVSAELTRTGQLMRVGGTPYLHTLISSVPTAANAGFYAEIVAERATLRRLVEAGTRIVQLGYGAAAGQGGDVDDVVDRAQAEIYDVTERRTSEDYVRLEQLLQGTMDEIDAISSRGGQSIGVPTGFSELDEITNGLHAGQMIIVAARPAMGKSTLGLDFARACSIKNGLTSAIFSLEMSKSEITMRLLSAEAKVPLHHMRSGHMSDDDWARLARRMGEVADAPLYIDDSPNLTMMEIRAKARRLRQRHDLRLVIVDYLQLMTSGKRVENRQVEVSEFSRSLKLLAKELEVPVVALAQLNRGPEQRTDKKPMLSDLRESGCMTADTAILRADTGAPVTFGELLARGVDGVQVWSLDEDRRLVPSPLTAVFPSGEKEVFRLTLASGRQVKASGNHPFRTFGGWTALAGLAAGVRIAVPRRIPAPLAAGLGWSEHRLGLLAHLLRAGCVQDGQPVHYRSQDEASLAFVEQAASAEFGIQPRRVRHGNWQHACLPSPHRPTHGRRNPIVQWFHDLGIADLRPYEKRLPDELYRADDAEIRLFLRHLWVTDGSVFLPRPDAGTSIPRACYSTSSRALADGVVHLLSRLGLAARLHPVRSAESERAGYRVVVAGSDTLPREVWDLVQTERIRAGFTERALQAAIDTADCGSTLHEGCPSRDRLVRIADVLDSDPLREMVTDDVRWDRVVRIESLGPQPVYDATVKETHNFVADGIIAHNSLEQDADMVVLLHREDVYERESPRAGEADLILAKHRNGPTGLVTVAFQGHYSRFVDMAG